jgi:hypothetical protein
MLAHNGPGLACITVASVIRDLTDTTPPPQLNTKSLLTSPVVPTKSI